MANSNSSMPRTPIINRNQMREIMIIGDCSVLRISVSKNGDVINSVEGSAFLGETLDHQKVLFTAKHIFLFSSFEDKKLTLKCANGEHQTMFTIPLEEYDREKVFLLDDPDSAAIILNDNLVRQCQNAGSAFVNIGKFEPILKPIIIQGFPKGGQLSLSTGWITDINEERFSHNAGSEPGSSGSLVLELEENSINVAGIHYGSGNEGQTGLATNINYIIHQILLHNQLCFPHVTSLPQSVLEYWKPYSNLSLQPHLQLIQFVRRIPKHLLCIDGENKAYVNSIAYNSAGDELLLVANSKRVCAMCLHKNTDILRDVYRSGDTEESILSMCLMSELDTLIISSVNQRKSGSSFTYWLVALSRSGSEWREAHRVQTEHLAGICCALNESRVLIGNGLEQYLELFSVEGDQQIARICSIHVPEYWRFSATFISETLVAMSYKDNSVRVSRLRGDKLEEIARIQMKDPFQLLWVAGRLLVTEYYFDTKSYAVVELEMRDTRLECRRELMGHSDRIYVRTSWCEVEDGLAVFDWNSRDIMHYSLA